MVSFSGKKVAVVGMGLSGVAAAILLRKHGARVTLTDDKPREELSEEMKKLEGIDVNYRLRGIAPDLLLGSALIVLSPGVPSDLPPIERARKAGVEIISEIELASSFCDAPLIAITGTNGKTTTTMLVYHILVRAGLKAGLAGNIEIPFSSVVLDGPFDVIVLEVSSFQLENIRSFRPRVGVLLNITPDHLTRYNGMDDYAMAKFALFKNQSTSDFAVLNRDDGGIARTEGRISSRVLKFSMREEIEEGAFLRKEKLVARFEGAEMEVIEAGQIPLLGRHNVENVLAAIAATLPMGVTAECYEQAVKSFRAVEHRLEKVREKDGVLFVNDSKATNIDSLIKALESFDRPVILIAGGRGKKSSYAVLRPLVSAKVKAMITIGEDAPLLEEALGDIVPTQRAQTLPDAVKVAAALARSGDCILLAPACASFDMFRNYEHRGRVFKEAVASL